MPNQPSEAEVVFNRASVALAKSQRLVASWLPPPTEAEQRKADEQEPEPELELEGPVSARSVYLQRLLGSGSTFMSIRANLTPSQTRRRCLSFERSIKDQLQANRVVCK